MSNPTKKITNLFSTRHFTSILILSVISIGSIIGISYGVSSSTGIQIPLYNFPILNGESTWDPVIDSKTAHPAVPFIAIVNPASGVGSGCPEPSYAQEIPRLLNAGIIVVGYVPTGTPEGGAGSRPLSEVTGEVDQWHLCYNQNGINLNGIFLDEMSNVAGKESYYSNIKSHIESKDGYTVVVGNPGTDTFSSYIGTVDNMAIWENSQPADIITELRGQDWASGIGWHTNFDKGNFSYLEYGQTTLDANYVVNASNHVAYMYITHDTLPNPWDEISSHLENLVVILDVPSIDITVESKDLSGNPITATDKNIKISAFNVLARNGTSPLFYNATNNTQYTITAADFDTFVFDHWEDSSTNPTRAVTPIASTTYTAFYENTSTPPSPPRYVVNLLDVYQSSSTALDTGTQVCLDVDLETASSCPTALTAGSTYRFEIEVTNTGDGSGSPTSFELRDVVASGDVFGSIPPGNLVSSGCSANTDWSSSISSDDVVLSSGTTCSIPAAGGSAEYWMVITLDTDADDGTGTFFISDGTTSDTSTTTTFTVNIPQQVPLTVKSTDLSGDEITGMWIELWQGNTQIETGFTPFSTTVQSGVQYEVFAGSFGGRVFDHWDDESTNPTRPFTITQPTTFTSFYEISLVHNFAEVTNDQTTTSTAYVDIPGASIADVDLVDGKKYLLVFNTEVSESNNANSGFIKAVHGSTTFEGSELVFEPTWPGPESRYTYFWHTVWTAAAGEDVKLQFKSQLAGDTMRADQITITAINLSDELTENTDWFFNQNTIDTTLASSYGTGNSASVTFTPNGSDDWLVLATSHLNPAATTVPQKTRITASGGVTDTGVEWLQQVEDDLNDRMVHTLAKVYTPTATSTTFTTNSESSSETGIRLGNSIFALNLNKMRNHAFQATPGAISISTSDNFPGTNVATTTITPSTEGNVWCLGFDMSASSDGDYRRQRMQVDNIDQPPTQTSDFYATPDETWDTTDKYGYAMQTIEAMTIAAHTLDVDATTGFSGVTSEDRLAMCVTMELAP